MTTIPLLSDEQWAIIEPLLPPAKGRMGRPMLDHRPVVEGAIYRLKAGIPWRYLPPQYGAWQTVHRRHHQWSTDGTWDRVLARVQADADARGELDWRVSVDSTIARVHLHGATAPRCSSGRRRTLDELRVARSGPGRPRTTPSCLRGDKAYSSRGHRTLLRSRGIVTVIPEPADQAGHRKNRGPRGGRPVSYYVEDYKNRNVIERFFNRMKNWRGLASRYDKHALVYRGGVVLAAILDWLR